MVRLGWLAGILAVVSVGAVAGGPVVASSPPPVACSVCGVEFHPSVTHSTAELVIQPDGDVRWTVENRLPDDVAERFRDTPDALRKRAMEAPTSWGGVERSRADLETWMEGDTAHVSFVDPGVATRHWGGTLALDYFQKWHLFGGYQYAVNADEFVVRAADDYELDLAYAGDPGGPRPDPTRTSVRWTGDSRAVAQYGAPITTDDVPQVPDLTVLASPAGANVESRLARGYVVMGTATAGSIPLMTLVLVVGVAPSVAVATRIGSSLNRRRGERVAAGAGGAVVAVLGIATLVGGRFPVAVGPVALPALCLLLGGPALLYGTRSLAAVVVAFQVITAVGSIVVTLVASGNSLYWLEMLSGVIALVALLPVLLIALPVVSKYRRDGATKVRQGGPR